VKAASDPQALQRERMARELAEKRGIRDARVLEAVRRVPRHLFVKDHLRAQAYGEHALPIAGGQTISQPWVVARMSELLEIGPTHTVLEIGTGSGYQTAILALLAKRVFSLERVAELAHQAIKRIRDMGIANVKIQAFDGTVGWSEMAPFDRILVTAGAPSAPKPLLDQLAVNGRMVIPEGTQRAQRLVVYSKSARGVRRKEEDSVSFVPLIGRHGWPEGGA
jgi:protein-L-isoaspartate(D-aspartate) O-methyltransferase